MSYYLGAYYFLKLKPLTYGIYKGQTIFTGCRCINESYFDASWALSWGTDINYLNEVKQEFELTTDSLEEIQSWCDKKFNEKHLGWINTFNDINTLFEYKNRFFNEATDFEMIGLYFDKESIQALKNEFEPNTETLGSIGILDCLNKKTPEQTEHEKFIGYELIELDFTGDYHSFYCLNNSDELIKKFNLSINKNGLIDEFQNKKELLKYLNNAKNYICDGPWFLVKVNKVIYPPSARL